MSDTSVGNLRRAVRQAQGWIDALSREGGFEDPNQSYAALRAVLQSLRDRLTADEAANLGAQLPLVLRGVYYEGWRPAQVPKKQRDREAFLSSIGERLAGTAIDPESACQAAFSLLQDKGSDGEIEDVKRMMPAELRELWPARA